MSQEGKKILTQVTTSTVSKAGVSKRVGILITLTCLALFKPSSPCLIFLSEPFQVDEGASELLVFDATIHKQLARIIQLF
jgi:hypothetical protein